jgi:hypothetical protein
MFKLALHHPFEKQVLAVLASPFLEVHKLNNKKMKNYVVGILSMFENDLKLFKITAENEYEAVKKGMIEFAENPESKKHEIDWQNSEDYPTDLDGLYSVYVEVPFSVVEVGSF